MAAQTLDGKGIAAQHRQAISAQVAQTATAGARPPGLAVILVGDDAASHIYVNAKQRDCQEVGFHSVVDRLPAPVTQEALEERVQALNAAPEIHGILVQLPLPKHIDADRVIDQIDPAKDVDGFHPYNIGRLVLRRPELPPCTSKAVRILLDHTGIAYPGAHATIVGASNHVGRPIALELLRAGCTVAITHRFTRNTVAHARQADILISAVGRPGLVTKEWVKPGAIVVDVGISRDANGRLLGDVAFAEAKEVASWITPVPGGVGPMTRAALLLNTMLAAQSAGSIAAHAQR